MIPVLHGVWASGGLAGDFEHIETQTVGAGGAASITFSSIPGTYKHLQVRAIGRTNRSSFIDVVGIEFNGDTSTANYNNHILNGDGAAATSSRQTGVEAKWCVYTVPAANASSSIFGGYVIDVLDYASTSKYKTVRTLAGQDQNNTAGNVALNSNLWMNTAAVNSVKLYPYYGTQFVQHTSISLYGVK